MTSAPTPGGTSAPSIGEAMVRAQLDLATEWHFWAMLTHRDGRVFAGRVGSLRIFGTVMVRVDMPGEPDVTYGINPAELSDWVVCPEEQARAAAGIIGVPERELVSNGRAGGGHGDPL